MSEAASEDHRVTYAVQKNLVDRREAVTACAVVLELLRPHLVAATIDAYSDYRDELPAEAAAAERWLRDRGRTLGHRDPGMGIDLDLSDPEHWTVLSAYAPWSINVDLIGDAGLDLGGFHDCGYSIVAALTAGEARQLADTLADLSPVLPLEEVHARRRAEREASRAERRRRRRARIKALVRLW